MPDQRVTDSRQGEHGEASVGDKRTDDGDLHSVTYNVQIMYRLSTETLNPCWIHLSGLIFVLSCAMR